MNKRDLLKGLVWGAALSVAAYVGPADALMRGGLAVASSSAFHDSDWASPLNRPSFNSGTRVLSWIGPLNGGANNGNPVFQTKTLVDSGSVATTHAGQVITGLNISGGVTILHDNVTVQFNRCFGSSQGFMITIGANVTGQTIEDNLLDGQKASYEGICPSAGNAFVGTTRNNIRRNYISGFENHLTLPNSDANVGVTDNYFTACANSGDASFDGDFIELYGCDTVLVQHNTFDGANSQAGSIVFNSMLNMSNQNAVPVTNITVNNNMFMNCISSQNYIIDMDAHFSSAAMSWSCTGNAFFNIAGKPYLVDTHSGDGPPVTAPPPSPNSGNFTAATATAQSGALINGSGQM